jgi:hypothetical protein
LKYVIFSANLFILICNISSESNIRPEVNNYSVLRDALRFPTTKIRARKKISNAADAEIWASFMGFPNIFFNLIRKIRIQILEKYIRSKIISRSYIKFL